VVLEGEMTGIIATCALAASRTRSSVKGMRAVSSKSSIAHRKGLGRIVFLLADFGPDLNPAVEGGAQKRKTPLRMASCFMRRFAGRMVS
jgi:hypothetical protein